VSGTDVAVVPVIGSQLRCSEPPVQTRQPVTEEFRRPDSIHPGPLQARQPVTDEFHRPDPDKLVLGFRRHRMIQQTGRTLHNEKLLTTRQVTTRTVATSIHGLLLPLHLAEKPLTARPVSTVTAVLGTFVVTLWTCYSALQIVVFSAR